MITPHRRVACPQCTADLPVYHAESTFIGCPTCFAVSELTAAGAELRYKQPSRPAATGIISLGMTLNYFGRPHVAIASQAWRNEYLEYWNDEDGSGYEREQWFYHEVTFFDGQKSLVYIFHDAEGYHEAVPISPKYPNFHGDFAMTQFEEGENYPSSTFPEIKNFLTGSEERIVEIGNSHLNGFTGELPYDPTGYHMKFNLVQDGGERYSVEFEEDDTPQTAEYYQERPFQKRALMEMMTANSQIASELAEGDTKQRNYNFVGLCLLTFAMASLLLTALVQRKTGNVADTSAILPAAQDTSSVIRPQLIKTLGPYRLRAGAAELEVSAVLPDNSNVWAAVDIVNAQNQVVNAVEKEFFRASGSEAWQEDGESGVEDWQESEVNETKRFQVPTATSYYLKLYASPNAKQPTSVRVRLTDGLTNTTWFLIAAGLGIALGAIAFIMGYYSTPWSSND